MNDHTWLRGGRGEERGVNEYQSAIREQQRGETRKLQ